MNPIKIDPCKAEGTMIRNTGVTIDSIRYGEVRLPIPREVRIQMVFEGANKVIREIDRNHPSLSGDGSGSSCGSSSSHPLPAILHFP